MWASDGVGDKEKEEDRRERGSSAAFGGLRLYPEPDGLYLQLVSATYR